MWSYWRWDYGDTRDLEIVIRHLKGVVVAVAWSAGGLILLRYLQMVGRRDRESGGGGMLEGGGGEGGAGRSEVGSGVVRGNSSLDMATSPTIVPRLESTSFFHPPSPYNPLPHSPNRHPPSPRLHPPSSSGLACAIALSPLQDPITAAELSKRTQNKVYGYYLNHLAKVSLRRHLKNAGNFLSGNFQKAGNFLSGNFRKTERQSYSPSPNF